MKNHWLKNKDKITVEDVRLARELEAEGVESVCEWEEMASSPDAYKEIMIGAGWCGMPTSNEIKIEDITCGDMPEIRDSTIVSTCILDFCGQPICTSDISSMPIDASDYVKNQTALSELVMEIGDGSIKYVREAIIGSFTFKDAGELGVDIFAGGTKVGWLNNQGEKALKQWLGEKTSDVSVFSKFCMISTFPDPYKIQEVSNEVIQVLHAGKYNVYQLKNKNIVPGSVLLTTFVNDVAIQSENLTNYGILTDKNYFGERTAMSGANVDYNTGLITVNWVNFNPMDTRRLSVCYEYKDCEVK